MADLEKKGDLEKVLKGRVVVAVDEGFSANEMDPDGSRVGVTLELDDGSSLDILAYWCNDGTADLGITFNPSASSAQEEGQSGS